MSEVVQETHQEFWRAPSPVATEQIVVRDPVSTMAESCSRCGSEFLLGSRFCHSCGGRRQEAVSADALAEAAEFAHLWKNAVSRTQAVARSIPWSKISLPSWLRYLHFHEIKRWIGLPTPSLVAFIIGLGCVVGALAVSVFYKASNMAEFQAIQMWRMEWLLAATASFVAGILLKKPHDDND
jgi:hypothetical protein